MRAVGYNETIDKNQISPYLPDFVADGILNVDFALLHSLGIKHLMMDLDNTLRQAYSKRLDQEVIEFFETMAQKYHFKSVNIVSNNNRNLNRYAEPLGARIFQPFWQHGIMIRKPSAAFYKRVLNDLNIDPKQAVMIGDKVRLDVAGANKVGIYTVLVRRRGRDYWFDYLLLARWREYRTLAAALKTKSKHLHSTPDYIRSGLKQLGLVAGKITGPQHLTGGLLSYTAECKKTGAVTIKVINRWASTANSMRRLWRYLLPSWNGEESPYFGAKHILEREAYVTRLAAEHGVHTPEVFGVVDLGDYRYGIVTQHIAGETLDVLPRKRINQRLLGTIWREVARLHKHGISHGDCRITNIRITRQGQPWFCNFDFATTSAALENQERDNVELLVSMALTLGTQDTVRAAQAALDPQALSRLIPLLQTKNLSYATRVALKHATNSVLLDELVAEITASSKTK